MTTQIILRFLFHKYNVLVLKFELQRNLSYFSKNTGLSVCFLCEKDSHLLQYNENLDAYLTSGSIKCIKKLHQLVVDPKNDKMVLSIQKSTFYCIVSTEVQQGCCTVNMAQ